MVSTAEEVGWAVVGVAEDVGVADGVGKGGGEENVVFGGWFLLEGDWGEGVELEEGADVEDGEVGADGDGVGMGEVGDGEVGGGGGVGG
ncbi:hypothetical protein, partial [Kocuria rosea]|uniref:hypothetical protein n=1 Tax=Kocuria rosea TaxID=1275 RepID=UPI001C92C8CC